MIDFPTIIHKAFIDIGLSLVRADEATYQLMSDLEENEFYILKQSLPASMKVKVL